MPDKVLVQWQKITKSLIGNQNKEYLDFLQTTSMLFSKKILHQTSTATYLVDTLDFDMEYRNEIEIKFHKVVLTCKGQFDQMQIRATSGVYIPARQIWKGDFGTADFKRVLGDEPAYVEFGKYQISLDQNSYQLDTVKLTYPRFFKEPVLGKFKEKLIIDSDTNRIKKAGFPEFKSFRNDLNIRGIVGDESFFVGGFAMQGKSITTAPRCRLISSWGCSRSQGYGCSPFKEVRELGLKRRETVWSLSAVGVGNLTGAAPSTRGPEWTYRWCTCCFARSIAG